MTEIVINTSILPEVVAKFIFAEQVRIIAEDGENGEVTLVPLKKPKLDENGEEIDYIAQERGCLAKYPQISVDKFLARNRAEK
ncbi:MAG: hypothetical protein FWG65_01615 [Turicibacter sp.]|nr:hypothetical protein [Turicibacter sp.]